MLVPWYAAYGIQGTDEIPPYENLIIEIDIK
jgi:FKBP-type peptidyl-prolyl cis-trans isomerase